MSIGNTMLRYHDRLVTQEPNDTVRRYKILKDYRDTYMEKQVSAEEKMVYPIFRVFEAAKPERDRKLNIDPTHCFDWYSDSVMDYASIMGYKLNKPWQQYNRLIAVQIPLCPNDCWHCYLPKELYVGAAPSTDDRFEVLSSENIIDRFLEQRDTDRAHNKHSNVLRITGGEPFLLPELLVECLRLLKEKNLDEDIFVWTETNLEPFVGEPGDAFMDRSPNKDILEELGTFNNFLVHPCFHGLDEVEFSNITNFTRHSITLDQQIGGLKRLVDSGIDVYPTFGSNVCNPQNVSNLFKKLQSKIHPNIPLKLALIEYKCDYEPVVDRVRNRQSPPKLYPRFANLRIWNQLLLERYGIGYGILPRHIISLKQENGIRTLEQNVPDGANNLPERIYFFKSSYRNHYHREVLDVLAYPKDHIIEVNYDKKHVQDDLFFHMSLVPEIYRNKKGVWVYVDTGNVRLTPLREFKIINLKEAGGILSATLKLGKYISFTNIDGDNLEEQFTYAFKCYFGAKNLPPGGKYMLVGESFFNSSALESSDVCTTETSQAYPSFNGKVELGCEFKQFQSIIPHLISDKKMKRSVFYRIVPDNLTQIQEDEEVYYKVTSGDSFRINLEHYLPNYSEFDENKSDDLTICLSSSNKVIEINGPGEITFGKYGGEPIDFVSKRVRNETKVAITFWNKGNEFNAPKITINIKIVPQTVIDAALSMIAALLFTIGTSGIAMYAKAIDENKSVWASLFIAIKEYFWQPPAIWIPNAFYILCLGVTFFVLSWFLAKGIKPIKLS
jgi:uncharacterized Fe-S cluster-containing radical SAM superfamily protein